jgi:hypothetical protein
VAGEECHFPRFHEGNLMTKRIGPEAKIVAMFLALPPESRRIVLEIIRSQQPRPTPKPRKRKSEAAELLDLQNSEVFG